VAGGENGQPGREKPSLYRDVWQRGIVGLRWEVGGMGALEIFFGGARDRDATPREITGHSTSYLAGGEDLTQPAPS
jgi:hypothetical protein